MSIITGLSGLSATTAWQVLMKDPAKQIDKFAKNKDIQSDLEYFKKNIGKFTSVEALLKDQRATRVLLSAYDLESEMTGLGRIKKILTEDPTATGALSSRLVDKRFAAMAKDLRLDQSMDKLDSATFLTKISDKYVQSEFEEALGNIDPALRKAAYFARNITSANNVYSILGDSILRDVVQNTVNLPAQLAYQPVDTQARAITARLKIDQLGVSVAKSNISASQLTQAKADAASIESNLKISDAALAQIKAIQDKVAASINAYDTYAAKTFSPAEIATQQQAIPQMLRFEQLLNSGSSAISSVTTSIQQLQTFTTNIANATTPAQVDALKTKFNALVDSIGQKLTGANVVTPTTSDLASNGGTPPTENIFQFGSDTVLTAKLKADSTNNLDINVFNTSDLTALLDNAKASFAAVADKNDSGNIGAAVNALSSALTRGTSIKSSITSDIADLKDKMDDPDYGATMNSADIIKGKRSIDDAMARTKTIASLLDQIGTVASQSAALTTNADRTALTKQFESLRTQLNNVVNNTNEAGLDNLLTTNDQKQYSLISRPDGNGGTENLYTYSKGIKSTIDDIINDLNASSVGDKTTANALSMKAIQLTNRTDTATRTLTPDQNNFNRIVSNYDPKAKIDASFFDLKTSLDATIAKAAVGTANMLSSDQTTISFTVTSSSAILRLKPVTTFKSDVLSQLNNLVSQIGNGLSATRTAANSLNDVLDRTRRTLSSDNRNLSFEQGKIGAVLDILEPDTAADGTAKYKTNSFTEKFIVRYLSLNSSSTPTFSSSQASVLNLLGGSTDTSSMTANLLSLSLKI